MTSSSVRVLVDSDRALPIVHASVSALSGAATDPQGLEGLSRFTARLMRRTAGGQSFASVESRIDLMGASVGMDCGHESTSFSGGVLSRNFEDFSSLFVDMIHTPGFNEEEFARLKRETAAEFLEALDDDERLVNRWFTREVFQGHAYGRTVLGNTESLDAITEADVRSCWVRHFVQDNLVFSFAGAVDADKVNQWSENLRQALPPGNKPPSVIAEPNRLPGRRLVFVDKPERSQTQILIGGLGSHPQDSDHMDLLVANTVFGGTFTARLSQEVRAKRGWSYGAYSSMAFDRQRQSFSLWTFPSATDAAACIQLKLKLLEEWWNQGITAEELQRAQTYLVQSFAFARDTTSKRISLALESSLSDLPAGYYSEYVERVAAVTLESANVAIRNKISLQDLVIAVVGTHADVGAQVEDAVGELRSKKIIPFDTP